MYVEFSLVSLKFLQNVVLPQVLYNAIIKCQNTLQTARIVMIVFYLATLSTKVREIFRTQIFLSPSIWMTIKYFKQSGAPVVIFFSSQKQSWASLNFFLGEFSDNATIFLQRFILLNNGLKRLFLLLKTDILYDNGLRLDERHRHRVQLLTSLPKHVTQWAESQDIYQLLMR